MVKVAPLLNVSIGLYGVFWIFSGVVLFMFFFNLLFMPETKGRNLIEIENYYANGRRWGDEEKEESSKVEKAQVQDEAKVKAEIKRLGNGQKTKC